MFHLTCGLCCFRAAVRLSSLRLSTSVGCYDNELLSSLAPLKGGIISKVGAEFSLESGLVIQRSKDDALEVAWGPANKLAKMERPFRIDFTSPQAQRRQRECNRELVVKAIGKPDLVVDFTAGLGRDASLFAAAGLKVVCVERNWVIYQLLQDALRRLSLEGDEDMARRMVAMNVDSGTTDLERFRSVAASMINERAKRDAEEKDYRAPPFTFKRGVAISVYLDPMYPLGKVGRKSAVKKEARMLHRIVGVSTRNSAEEEKEKEKENDHNLFARAMELATDKVVVKRPINSAPLLEGRVPSSAIMGSTHRFEVYQK